MKKLDPTERLAKRVLEKEDNTRYIKRGTEPPDFVFTQNGKRIGVEVTNLNASSLLSTKKGEPASVMEVQYVLAGIINSCLEEFEKNYSHVILNKNKIGYRIFCVDYYDFQRRPDASLEKLKTLNKKIKNQFMQELKRFFQIEENAERNGYTNMVDTPNLFRNDIKIDEGIALTLVRGGPNSVPDGKIFIQVNGKIVLPNQISDGEGTLLSENSGDIKNCIEHKKQKLKNCAKDYDELWLFLYDQTSFSHASIAGYKDVRKAIEFKPFWSRVVIFSTKFGRKPQPNEFWKVDLCDVKNY